jgi:homoserine O-acetyltransferase
MLLPTSRTFMHADFSLESGATLPELTVAYESWGTLEADGSNAILLCHGFTSNPHAGGNGGWWENLIGPGRALDTDRFFVVCSNMIGSAYGSSGPGSINPETGRPYGPAFPAITTNDMVAAQSLLIDHLGIEQLAAVVGFSYGGYLTFLWGVTHPDRMRALVPAASAIRGRGDPGSAQALRDRYATCPGWNGGDYYGNEKDSGVYDTLVTQRIETLKGYGLEQILADKTGDAAEAERQLTSMAQKWAEEFDANSMIVLRDAAVKFDASPLLERIEAPLLYVLSRSDALFPPSIAPDTMALLKKHDVYADYFEIDSEYGHRAPSDDWHKWADTLADFLNRHAA